MTDNRPDPKPRKNPQLWQSYLFWEELMLMRQRHNLRISSIKKGKSNLDAAFEQGMIDGSYTIGKKRYDTFHLDDTLKTATKMMVDFGKMLPVWDWISDIKGFGAGPQAAKILALIDDIEKFESIAKLWRYSGYGLYQYYHKDGDIKAPIRGKQLKDNAIVSVETKPQQGWDVRTARDRGVAGYVLPFNRTLKSTLYVAGDNFIRHQTPYYVDIYYAEKKRQRELHPEKIVKNGKTMFNDAHIDNRGRRKMIKEFLKDLWVQWRLAEGLEISTPYDS